jgi:hypothetical protein
LTDPVSRRPREAPPAETERSIAHRLVLTILHLAMFLFFVWLLLGGEQLPMPLAVIALAAGLYVMGEAAWRFWRDRGDADDF